VRFPQEGMVERWDFKTAVGVFLNTYRKEKLDDLFLDKDKL
jgi:hypothetical protein